MKIKFLIEHPEPRAVLHHQPNQTDFVEKLGIKRSTFRDQLLKDRFSLEVQSTLAQKLGFGRDWPEWATGTADEFRDRYIAERKRLTMDRRDVTARIGRGPWQEPSASSIVGLAAIEIDGSQFGQGSVAVEVLLSCGEPFILGNRVSIRSGRIEVRCAPGLISKDTLQRWINDGERQAPNAHGGVKIAFEAGTRSAPAWRVTAIGTKVGSAFLDPGFATLEELAPGDTIEARLGTWLGEIEDTGEVEDGSDGLALLDNTGAELQITSAQLSIRKRRVIACIRKKLFSADANGYVVLATHTLNVVEEKS
ncbi:MAG: hypothetical protein K8S25_17885 [Alphaproteobacteria bacterium]|nr:hypothetical protein [Alphaproteobacteria bacterium]